MRQRLYRRMVEIYVWHFCRNCPNWPVSDYQEAVRPTKWGSLCSKCQALLLLGKCDISIEPEE